MGQLQFLRVLAVVFSFINLVHQSNSNGSGFIYYTNTFLLIQKEGGKPLKHLLA